MEFAAGIDFGGSSAKVGLVDRTGRIESKSVVRVNPQETFEGVVNPVAACLRDLIGKQGGAGRLVTIGIGTPGFIDKRKVS